MSAIREIWMYQTGRARVSRRWLEAHGGRESCWLPFLNWLVVHEEHGPILIDAGLGSRTLRRQERWWGRAFAGLMRISLGEGMDLRARVAQCGVDPDDVRHGVFTHMHFDHTGGVPDFPGVIWHTNAHEWESARAGRALVRGYLRSDYEELEPSFYEWEATELYEPFSRACDLFGDGSLVMLPTAGHSAGHAAVLLSAGPRRILIAGDAAFTLGNLARRKPLGWFPRRVADNLSRAELTLEQLRAFLERNVDVETFTSHDPDVGDDVVSGPLCLFRSSPS